MRQMPSVQLDQGSIHYEEAGPADGRPAVFVHGFLMAGNVWSPVVERLAERGVRCIVPTWPMGAHSHPFGIDLAPPVMAGLVAQFLDALGLEDVALVGNDSGGAVGQITVAYHPERIGALVLTNCDTLEHFPPTMLKPLVKAAASKTAMKAMLAPMRSAAARRSPVAYGLLTHADIDHLTSGWVAPALADERVTEDARTFMRGMDKALTLDAAKALKTWGKPITLVWGADDRLFTVKQARAFADAVPVAAFDVVEGARTLPMLDRPEEVAELIAAAISAPAPAPA
jgi:pimeloyl-ACP methyl ester carboxylesterase